MNETSEPEAPPGLPADPASPQPEKRVLAAPGLPDPPTTAGPPSNEERPGYLFFGGVASVALILDISTKAWAEIALTPRPGAPSTILILKDHLMLTLAYNKGGAWGLLQDSSELVRLPFFLAVSVMAVLFIVSLYGKLGTGQTALKWGLPLVLGGALGNLSDRITRSSVIDFIDYRADWVLSMNRVIAKAAKGWSLTDHWPTFNIADVAICIGVGLMAVDMFTSQRTPAVAPPAPAVLGPNDPPVG